MVANRTSENAALMDTKELRGYVEEVLMTMPIFDMHTHLFAPEFTELNLWGIDELLTYHYLVAELFRSSAITPTQFWSLTKSVQADLIWKTLFVEQTPLSEATRGVVTVLTSLGLDARMKDLRIAREFFREQRAEDYLQRVMNLARVSDIVMTNDPFDTKEAFVWQRTTEIDRRFHAALRLDRMLNEWTDAALQLEGAGYKAKADLSGDSIKEARRFLDDWISRMKPLYMAVSLPDDFAFPERSVRHKLMTEVVLPTCREHDLPFALMIGVRRGVNPALRLAGDGLGQADVHAVERLCAEHPDNRFFVTMLARENQHGLCVAARKFSNLMIFGCWWFVNNPSIIAEMTRERIELLGTSFIPQHSDARVFDQLVYKWQHSRRIIADALNESYQSLLTSGWTATRAEVERDVEKLFSGNCSRDARSARSSASPGCLAQSAGCSLPPPSATCCKRQAVTCLCLSSPDSRISPRCSSYIFSRRASHPRTSRRTWYQHDD